MALTRAEISARYRERHPDRVTEGWKRWADTHDNNGRVRVYWQRMRQEVLDAYGRKCTCCGETQEEFLSIDHIDGNGAEHRRELGIKGGGQFYAWLRRQGFPDGFQILCMNCNHAKGHYGTCPHKQ